MIGKIRLGTYNDAGPIFNIGLMHYLNIKYGSTPGHLQMDSTIVK